MTTHLIARRTAVAQTILTALAQCGGNRSHAAVVAGYADASSMRRAARRAGHIPYLTGRVFVHGDGPLRARLVGRGSSVHGHGQRRVSVEVTQMPDPGDGRQCRWAQVDHALLGFPSAQVRAGAGVTRSRMGDERMPLVRVYERELTPEECAEALAEVIAAERLA